MSLEECGRDEAWRRVLEANIRMFDRLGDAGGADPWIGALGALARAEPAADFEATEAILRPAIGRLPAGRRLPWHLEERLAVQVLKGVDPCPPRAAEPGGDPIAHARDRRGPPLRLGSLGVGPVLLAAVSRRLTDVAAGQGAG